MILVPVQIENLTTRKDSSLKIVLGTHELTPEKAGKLFQLLNKYAYAAFKPEDFNKEELDAVEDLKTDDLDKKTLSQRTRSCLYVLYTKNSDGFDNFKDFYTNRMEQFIDSIKEEIEEYN